MNKPSTVQSGTPQTTPPTETQCVTINLNIGVFFDGTNNNAVQSMIALHNRRKQFFKKYNKEIKKRFPENKDLYSIPRSDFEKNPQIGTKHELDNIFGYSKSMNFDIEKSIADANLSEYRYSSAAEKYDGSEIKLIGGITKYFIDDARRERLSRMAGNNAKKLIVLKELASVSTSQGAGYTNVAILNSLYQTTKSDKQLKKEETISVDFYHSIYIEGAGANEEINVAKQIFNMKDSIIGLGFGVDKTGVAQKCRKAIQQVKNIYAIYTTKADVKSVDIKFDIFGFGRGAATARCFTYILNPQNESGHESINKMICGTDSTFLTSGTKKLHSKEVRVLGLYDTVSSIGVLREGASYLIGDKVLKMSEKADLSSGDSIFHDTNVDYFGLYSTDQVNAVLHICALDEFRKNFALVDIRNCTSTKGLEIYIPGCHTDIGGGSALGLDKFKIINCDEIATRGAILYNLYIRTNGLYESIKGMKGVVQDVSVLVGSLSNPAVLPVAYATAKGIIPDIHKTIKGLFSLLNGYESIEAYYIKNGIPVKNKPRLRKSGYSLIESSLKVQKSTTNAVTTLKKNTQFSSAAVKSLSDKKFKGSISTANDLYKIGKDTIMSLRQCKDSLEEFISNIEKSSTTPHSLPKDVRNILEKEKNVWLYEVDLLKESIETFELIFNGHHEDWIIPIEQRRICMYTGIPYDSGVKNNKSKMKKIKPLCVDTLKEMGWLKDDENPETETTWVTGRPTSERIECAKREGKSIVVEKTKVAHFFDRDNIGICKYTKPGYTLIALRAMYAWAKNSKGCKFDEFPVGIYDVPDDISKYYEQIEKVTKENNGRFICPPNANVICPSNKNVKKGLDSVDGYRYLRQNYLHISINQQVIDFADNGIVNGPSFMTFDTGLSSKERDEKLAEKRMANKVKSYNEDNVITRRIYPGVKSTKSTTSILGSAVGGKVFVDAPSKEYWYLDSGVK